MKFYIPYNEEINLENIEYDFMLKYYVEMGTSNGKLFYWFGPEYVALEKNMFVYDLFTVKQEGDKTVIKTQRGQNRWFGLPFVNYFVAGDFYDDVNLNFKKYLMRRYGYVEEDIVTKTTWWEKYSKFVFMWFGLNLAAFLIFIAVGIGAMMLNSFVEERGMVSTNTYSIEKNVVDSTEEGEIIYEYKLVHQPTHQILLTSEYELYSDEINNYAIIHEYTLDNYTLCSPEGKVVFKKDSPIYFETADFIYSYDWTGRVFYNLDGTPSEGPFFERYFFEIEIAYVVFALLLFILANVYTFRKVIKFVKKKRNNRI